MKTFDPSRDIVNLLSSINETITIGGSIFTGSAGEAQVKRFTHWTSASVSGSFYEAIYSANYSSSIAEELIDVSFGLSISSSFYSNTKRTNQTEKNRIYRLFAKILLGDEDEFFNIDNVNVNELIFLSVKRSQFKDEIQKGTLSLTTIASGSYNGTVPSVSSTWNFNDSGAENSYSDTSRGHVSNLLSSSGRIVGQIYYQAGTMVLIPDRVSITSSNVGNTWSGSHDFGALAVSGGGGKLDNTLDSIRYRLRALTFNNQSNLHSTFFFTRALNDEFNYSSNPTFVDTDARIIPTSGASGLKTRTYITKVGLLGENGETLAVATLSEPLKKTPDNEITLKVRLDF